MKYNWQHKDWPNFNYDLVKIQDLLLEAVEKISLLTGGIKDLAKANKLETTINIMVSEAIKNSEIEGEIITEQDVYSSVRKQLGLKTSHKHKNSKAEAISQITVESYRSYDQELSKEQLNHWHAVLFKNSDIETGKFRTHDDAMQIVSGYEGKSKVHFEAPPSSQIEKEMQIFIEWFNQTAPGKEKVIKAAPLRAAITHLYFESIHPYEDGNGRIGRILAEKALAQSIGYPIFLCLSQAIESKKKLYYNSLEQAQKSNEITAWLEYFFTTLIAASSKTEELLQFVIKKSHFYKKHETVLNPRQAKTVTRMLEEGPNGFKGGINSSKHMKINKCSKATATRDLADLVEKQVLKKRDASGRSTSYDLKF